MMPLPRRRSVSAYLQVLLVCAITLGLAVQRTAALETRAVRHLFDLTKAGNTTLSLPSDVAVSPDGRIYVVDGGNHRVAIYKTGGAYLKSIGKRGTKKGSFSAPMGITVDQKGRVYVADTNNHRIQIFTGDGKFLSQFPLRVQNKAVRPIDVAVSPSGDAIYVTGNTNHRVMVYSRKGKLLRNWGGEGNNPGEFRYPATVAVTQQGEILVVDVLNSRVQMFDVQGKLSTMVGSWGVLPGQLFRPKGVAIDQQGRIYVSDSYLGVIQVFDSDTRFSHVLGARNKPHRFTSPGGIVVNGGNRIYVAEMLNNKVSVYKLSQ